MDHAQEQRTPDPAIRLGGACIIAGSLAVLAFRMAHGDLPAADPDAALRFIAEHPLYAGVHLGTILGVLGWVGGFITLSRTLDDGVARVLGRLGTASMLVGAAIFIVEHSIDGVAGQDLATAWATAAPAGQADLVLAAQTAFTMLRGTSLVSIITLWGLPLVLFGLAAMTERYPAWLAWTGMVVGAVTTLAAMALLLQPDIFPGVLLYGVLVSVVVQLWSLGVGIATYRRKPSAAANDPSAVEPAGSPRVA
jgi:hypothetical protein